MISIIIKKEKSQILNLKSQISCSVSIIICAKNERENLQKNLPFILNQQYPNFEVIVVDDGSDVPLTMNPETSSGQADERVKIISLSKEEKIGLGKKYALQKGIELASNDVILLTDADCQPASENWIKSMVSLISDTKKIVLGISPYRTKPTVLNCLIEYETAQTAMQYTGFALLGNPYMGVGRNVCYDTKLLKSKTWSAVELSIASGDDDLIIQSLATNENTVVCLSPDSFTISPAKSFWKDWIKQKLRHYESGKLYKFSHQILLGNYLLTKLLLYISFIFLLMCKSQVLILIIMLSYISVITLLNFIFHKKTAINTRWYLAGFNDILYCIFTVALGVISRFKTTSNWK